MYFHPPFDSLLKKIYNEEGKLELFLKRKGGTNGTTFSS